jgi:hypothetical protein
MKKYIVVKCDTIKELEEKVTEYIERGYVPIGGVHVCVTSFSEFTFLQAVTTPIALKGVNDQW